MFKTEEYGVYFQVEENSFFLDEYDIWNGRVGSLLTCSQLCARQAVCSSANFVSKDGRCSLHRETRKMHLDRLLKQQGSFYVEKVCDTFGITVISFCDCENYHRLHWYATLEIKTSAEMFPRFPSIKVNVSKCICRHNIYWSPVKLYDRSCARLFQTLIDWNLGKVSAVNQ